jgi:hypothetical protein
MIVDVKYVMLPIEILGIIFTYTPCVKLVTSRLNRYWYSVMPVDTDVKSLAKKGDCFSAVRSGVEWLNMSSAIVDVLRSGCPILESVFMKRASAHQINCATAFMGGPMPDNNSSRELLYYACAGRQIETSNSLMDQFVNAELSTIRSIFYYACDTGMLNIIKRTIERIPANIPTGLGLAVMAGQIEVVRELIGYINSHIFYYVGACGYPDIVDYVLTHTTLNKKRIGKFLSGAHTYGRIDAFEKILKIKTGLKLHHRGKYTQDSNAPIFQMIHVLTYGTVSCIPPNENNRLLIEGKYLN